MKRTAIILLAIIVSYFAYGQKVTFFSPEFEEGVKLYLGLSQEDDIQQSQTDTITSINLSGLGIKDIRDVVYLPSIKILDLSYNDFKDVQALVQLDSLHYIDLKGNNLEDISILSFISSDSILIDVSYNCIEDFSSFFLPTPHTILLIGTGMQQDKNAPYFDVYQLFVDINAEGKPEVFYRGYTNMEEAAYIACGNAQTAATMDGGTYSSVVPGTPTSAAMVILANGELGDTTWVVPPSMHEVAANASLTIATGLPENYTIANAYSPNGTVSIDGQSVTYTASNDFEEDVIHISYYKGSRLRGFTELYVLNPDAISTLNGDVNNDRQVNVTDVTTLVNIILGGSASTITKRKADVNDDGEVNVTDVTSLVSIILNQ